MTTSVAVAGALGAVAGAALPSLVARIPDREPPPGEPPRMPYGELAAAPRLWLWLAAATAAVWALLAWSVGPAPELPAYLVVAALGVAAAYVDLREHRLPDRLTYPAFVVGGLALAVAAAATGSWDAFGRSVLGAAAFVAFLFALALIRPADLGLGDVKLGGSLGLLLGWLSWAHVVAGIFLGFLLGGLFSAGLLAVRRAGRRTAIPLGPFLLAGALVAVIWGDAILR